MKKNLSIFLLLLICFVFVAPAVMAQTNADQQITQAANSFKQTTKTVVNAIIPAVLGIALITVIWMVSQNKPNAKEFIIGWISAAVIWGFAAAIINW